MSDYGCFDDPGDFEGLFGIGGSQGQGKVSFASTGCGLGVVVYFFDEDRHSLADKLVSEFFLEACIEIS